jgi:hypothetical protein
MKKITIWLALALITAAALSACGSSTAEPTPTPEGEIIEMELGGYTYQSIYGYEEENDGQVVNFYSENDNITMMLLGIIDFGPGYTPNDIVEGFLAGMSEDSSSNIKKSNPTTITIDSAQGTSFDLTGIFDGDIVEGQTFVVMPTATRVVFGFGLGIVTDQKNNWEEQGKADFNNLMNSIEILEVETSSTGHFSACTIASDTTYGYSEDNPIRIGGGEEDGEARAEAYFSALGGPYGETFTYEKMETIESNGTTMDVYQIDFAGTPLTMYLDIQNYETLMAPDQFICWEEIPLTAP